MSKVARVERLERRAGAGEGRVVVVWGDTVQVDGETLTVEEFRARYPGARVVNWPEDGGGVEWVSH